MMSYSRDKRRVRRLDSAGSSSDSDVSEFSVHNVRPPRRRINRRGSIASVSTNPEEDAYVMVLQNKSGFYDNLKSMASLRDVYDVTFLVGDNLTPVHGVRVLMASRSWAFQDLIAAHEEKLASSKKSKSSFRKAFKTIGKLTRMRSASEKDRLTIPMETYDPQTFERLMTYVHTGKLTVEPRTTLGLLNAGYEFGLQEILQACWSFALGCAVREDNLKDLLESAKLYDGQKMTTNLMNAIRSHQQDFLKVSPRRATLADFRSSLPVDEEDEYSDNTEEEGESDSCAIVQ